MAPQIGRKQKFKLTRAARIVYDDRKRFLAEVGFKSYRSYLASDLWKGIRRRVLDERPHCEYCGKEATQVHHSSYWPAVLRGEDTRPLHPVCAICHKSGEFSREGFKRSPQEATRAARRYGSAASSGTRPVAHRDWRSRAHHAAKEQGLFQEYLQICRTVEGRAAQKVALHALLGVFAF